GAATVLYHECRALLLSTSEVGAAKYALAIVGLFRRAEDDDLALTFGRHPAFTRIAVLALANATGDLAAAGQRLFPLVTGMAQVEIIELLAAHPTPDLRRWLLLHGLPPGYERYTALLVARACDVAGLLQDADDPTVIGACGAVLATLARAAVDGGPAGDLDHYTDAAVAMERYVARIVQADGASTVLGASDRAFAMLTHLDAFRAYLALTPPRFDPPTHARLTDAVRTRLADPAWHVVAEMALADADRAFPPSLPRRLEALSAAQAVGVPATEYLYRWLSSADNDSLPDYVKALGATVTAADAARFAEAARRAIDPDGQRSGAHALATTDPPPWPRVLALTYALDALRPYPTAAAARLVEAALRSRAVTNRAKAIAVLATWRARGSGDLIDPTIMALLERLGDDDPEPSVRAQARGLLAALSDRRDR
ncbi:MAG: hypothetical protein NZ518_01195, partial [Dehalococcoidia bacterium]|nr:hypothetical protein [Dehalococcoidia bacterium]